MRRLSLATAVTFAAVLFVMSSPTEVAAQSTNAVADDCGECELVEPTKYKCTGGGQPNVAPYCKGTWIFGIACSSCGGAGFLVTQAESGQLRPIVVAGLTISDTYLVPSKGCGSAKVARAFAGSGSPAARLDLPLIEVVARSEASATSPKSDVSLQTRL